MGKYEISKIYKISDGSNHFQSRYRFNKNCGSHCGMGLDLQTKSGPGEIGARILIVSASQLGTDWAYFDCLGQEWD